jgi:hypothetical protein
MLNNRDFPTIRQDTIDTLNDYVTKGFEPGSFCRAVLENNLMQAFGKADLGNRASLFEICSYVYNELPSICHGSPEKVDAWLAKFREVAK